MDSRHFDRFVRSLGAATSRRDVVTTAAAAIAAGFAALARGRGVGAQCAPGLTDCAGTCVDLQSDAGNCGACFMACGSGVQCIDGGCNILCFAPLIPCGANCYDLTNDVNHCGACFNACGNEQSCVGGLCVDLMPIPACIAPQIPCGEQCVDVTNDVNHCGACFNACGGDQYCLAGACFDLIPACIAPETPCGGNCFDLQTDPLNCGACFNNCASYGYVHLGCCGGVCVDLDSHIAHCGVCGQGCRDDQFCAGGVCVCLPDLTNCNGVCVDGGSDPYNCGFCGRTCAHQGGFGICCFGQCVDQTSDPINCGGCEIVCEPGQQCVNGACDGAEPGCPSGRLACGGVCVDPASDVSNCGGCGQACPSSRRCVAGACQSTAPPPSTGDDPWDLWLGATKLRGAVLYQRRLTDADDPAIMSDDPIGPVYTRSDLDRLVALGANYVDLVHPAIVGDMAPDRLDTDLSDNLDRLVDLAVEAGLSVVISFRAGPGRPGASLIGNPRCRAGGCFAPEADIRPLGAAVTLWTDEEAQAGWELAWRELADRYRAHPAVIGYHLLDSPNPPDLETWAELARRLTAAIRATDDLTPIHLTVPGRPADAFDEPLTQDDRTVHLFDLLGPERFLTQPPDATGALTYPGRLNPARDEEDGAFDRGWLEDLVDPLLAFEDREQRPAAIRAVGVPRWQPGAADYLDDVMSVCEAAGLNHALWAWYPAAWPPTADAYDITRGPDPANHQAVESDLLDVVRRHWSQNEDRR